MAGLTTTGITIDTLDEILAAIEADQLANIDPSLNLNPDDVLGQLNGIMAAALSRVHELMEEIYQSAYADTATGQALSYIAALTGAIRQEATRALLDVTLNGVDTTVVPAGTRAYPDGDPFSTFEITSDVTIVGTSEPATMRAVEYGSTTFAGDNVTLVIETPVAGLTSIVTDSSNALTPGLDEETDSELRFRREQSLAQAGASTVEAIRAAMLQVTGVDSCTVFENPTGNTDANGVPPNAIEVLVASLGAPNFTAQDVADAIWANKPAGTETYGTETPVTVIDSSGNSHSIEYSEATTTRTYVEVALTKTTDGSYLGDDGVAQAISTWATNSLKVGEDVYASDIINVVADLQGVVGVDVLNTQVDDTTPTVSTNLVIGPRSLATIAAADVTVTATT